ncbi:MAG: hypothetical protein KDK39_05080 [Leptospiraceae bacterium]|nr:hypothetical protein [Leptospiraceae bacterium]
MEAEQLEPDESAQAAPNQEIELEAEGRKISVRYVLKQKEDRAIDRFYQAMSAAEAEADGEGLFCENYFPLALGAEDEKRIQWELRLINEHIQTHPIDENNTEWIVATRKNAKSNLDLTIKPARSLKQTRVVQQAGRINSWFKQHWLKVTPILLGLAIALLPDVLPAIKKRIFRIFLRKKLAQQKNINAEVLQLHFDQLGQINAKDIQSTLAYINKLASRHDINLEISGEIRLPHRNSFLRAHTADSHGRISKLDLEGISIVPHLERGETIFVEYDRNDGSIDEIFLGDGERLVENENWYDFNTINKRTLDKRSIYRVAREVYLLFAASAALAWSASHSVADGSISGPLGLFALSFLSAIIGATIIYNQIQSQDHTKDALMKSFMEYRARVDGTDFSRVRADAHGNIGELENARIFLFDSLQPGEEIFIERNDNGEVINLFDLEGDDLFFVDYTRGHNIDLEELQLGTPLAFRIAIALSFSLILVTGGLALYFSPTIWLYSFVISLVVACLLSGLFINSFLKRRDKKVILDHILARLRKQGIQGLSNWIPSAARDTQQPGSSLDSSIPGPFAASATALAIPVLRTTESRQPVPTVQVAEAMQPAATAMNPNAQPPRPQTGIQINPAEMPAEAESSTPPKTTEQPAMAGNDPGSKTTTKKSGPADLDERHTDPLFNGQSEIERTRHTGGNGASITNAELNVPPDPDDNQQEVQQAVSQIFQNEEDNRNDEV